MSPFPEGPTDAVGPLRFVLSAWPDDRSAEAAVRGVLGRKLAACASRWPVTSEYWWQGRRERANECLVLFKTSPQRVGALLRHIAEVHPYDVPEIVELGVGRVHSPYLQYLEEVLARSPEASPRGRARRKPTRSAAPRAQEVRRLGRTRAPRRRR